MKNKGVNLMLQIKQISKKYVTGNLTQIALDQVSLNLRDNEFVAILGPSGSGKTTLLNIIGGLDRYDSGDLIINGISTKKYKDRDWDSYRNHTIGFVFQSYNLIPHQTLLANVELALTISGISKTKRKQKALEALRKVGLEKQCHKKPSQLSGGQMQRVAIARALVNDPDILLADEPTGALDTQTSIQVMDLLKEVAKDRLVVMVTHNPELAQEYASRIVNLKDGKIISDSQPFNIDHKELTPPKHQNMGKASMSLLTSLSLSFNNLKTKKGRTILTAFAGSIGIIGIALILSLSNGVNSYIQSIEEETLSQYPLQIQSTGFDMTSMLLAGTEKGTDNNDDVKVSEMITNMFSKIGSNDLTSLKQYLENDSSNINEYTKAIEYSYNVIPQIFSSDVENLRQVNPDKSFNALGIGTTSNTNSMMSSAMSTNVFAAMPRNTSLFNEQYDIKAGAWPQNSHECVLVLTNDGSISDFMLYTLGLRDPKELDEMIKQFSLEEEVTVPNQLSGYSYEDILGITFKLVNATDFYQYDNEYNVYKDKSDDIDYMKNIVSNGEDLKIVGIVQPKEGVSATMLSTGIYYPATLEDEIIENAKNSEIVQAQLAKSDMNVFTGKSFNDSSDENAFDMTKLFSIDPSKMQSAFKFDQSKMNLDLSNLNNALTQMSLPEIDFNTILSQIKFDISMSDIETMMKALVDDFQNYLTINPEVSFSQSLKQLFEYLQSNEVNQTIKTEIEKYIQENGEIKITNEQLQAIFNKVIEDYLKENQLPDINDLNNYFKQYLNSPQATQIMTSSINQIIEKNNLDQQISSLISEYSKNAITSLSSTTQKELTQSMTKLSQSMSEAMSFDASQFASAIQMKMSEQELSELMLSLMSKETATYENNLRKLGYANVDEPAIINIYPKDFESKENVLTILDQYNLDMENNNQEEKVITYTDMVGALMSSVTDIVNVISYVLVAFVAISLIVSSIMIGVITYISVLERKKEIGILRAIGASKRNISNVFNAETFIIGLFSGLLGIGITLILLIPINHVVHSISNSNQINATLPIVAGIVLIALSTILTLIGGIIPSKKAAKEDPVSALRSE